MSDIVKQTNPSNDDAKREIPKTAESIPEAGHGELAKSKPLTPEEQMARFEEELKESDWGHQPC